MAPPRDTALNRPPAETGVARSRAGTAPVGASVSSALARDAATVTIAPDGRYVEASPAALELFGVGLDKLRAADVSGFVPDAFGDVARESWRVWVAGGMSVARGEREIVRPDGRGVRVRFETVRRSDGMYQETLEALAGNPDRRSAYTTLAAVLEAIREAERMLAELPTRSHRRRAIESDIGQLREAFEQIVRSRMWTP
jgi:PAS domain-containing protein